MNGPFQNENEIEAVVVGFESCTTGKDDFTHRAHLTVAVWYLLKSDRDEALNRMRAGLLRFLNHHSIDPAKYKEELTAAWIDLINETIGQLSSDLSLLEVTNAIVERFEGARLPVGNNKTESA